METRAPTVTLHLSTYQFPKAMANLVSWCIQESYDFFQTCHDAHHTEVEVLDQQHQSLVRLMLHVMQPDTPAAQAALPASVGTLPTESTLLVQHLVRLCTSTEEYTPGSGKKDQERD
jgi:hypothetical protein